VTYTNADSALNWLAGFVGEQGEHHVNVARDELSSLRAQVERLTAERDEARAGWGVNATAVKGLEASLQAERERAEKAEEEARRWESERDREVNTAAEFEARLRALKSAVRDYLLADSLWCAACREGKFIAEAEAMAAARAEDALRALLAEPAAGEIGGAEGAGAGATPHVAREGTPVDAASVGSSPTPPPPAPATEGPFAFLGAEPDLYGPEDGEPLPAPPAAATCETCGGSGEIPHPDTKRPSWDLRSTFAAIARSTIPCPSCAPAKPESRGEARP